MQDYTFTAGNILALFLWDRLKSEFNWSEDNYGGIVPVIPVQQAPELNSGSRPFVVFSQAQDAISPLWLIQEETIAFTVFSNKINDVNTVSNILISSFKRFDESARTVNNFIDSLPELHPAKNFDFKTIRVSGASGPQPSSQESGRNDGVVVIKAEYVLYDTTASGDGTETRN